MKQLFFGNPNTDCWILSLESFSVEEEIILLNGKLQADLFTANTPMRISPAVLSRFAAEVREIDRTLKGSASLENKNEQRGIRLKITVDHVGHVQVTGRYEIDENGLDFTIRSDQTQLSLLAKWLDRLLATVNPI